MLHTYTCNNFIGAYPVGTAAVIVAGSVIEAKQLLRAKLAGIGLPQPELYVLEVHRVRTSKPDVIILCNGDY